MFDEAAKLTQHLRFMHIRFSLVVLAVFFCGAALAQTTNAPPVNTNAPASPAAFGEAPAKVASSTTRRTRLLSLDDCIRLALTNNLDIQIQQYTPIVAEYAIGIAYGAYEPAFNTSGTKNYADNPTAPGINPQTGLPYTSSIGESDIYTAGIGGPGGSAQTLPFTGTQYQLNSSLSRNSTLIVPTNGGAYYSSPPIWESTAGITLTQPLLQNFWTDRIRTTIAINKVNLKTSQQKLRLTIMSSVTAVKEAYYNLQYARDNVEANITAYKLAQQLVSENLKRVEVGALAQLDEKQSESQAAASLAAVQLAQYQLGVAENTLKNLLTDHYSEWADVTPIPSEQLIAVPQTIDLQESWKKAVTQRPELIEAKLSVESQNVTLKYDFNQRFPELDLKGSYGRNALEKGLYENLGTIQQGNHSYYSYGAFASIPLGGNYSARKQYSSDKATLKQLLLTLKQTEQGILVAVQNDVGNLQSTFQQVQSTHDARVYAEEALDAEKKKLENGKSTSFIVLQLISNLTLARVSEIQALANYNNAIAQLDLDEGSTIEANHIKLNVN
jgi:outer membrane protein TolC